MESFVWGCKRDMASSSWKAPRETRWVSEEPARRRSGKALAFELPIYTHTMSVYVSVNGCNVPLL